MIILRILDEEIEIDKSTLQEHFENYNIGGTAFNTSYEICRKLGLVQEKSEQIARRGRASLIQSLTIKGKKIAKKVKEIDELLV